MKLSGKKHNMDSTCKKLVVSILLLSLSLSRSRDWRSRCSSIEIAEGAVKNIHSYSKFATFNIHEQNKKIRNKLTCAEIVRNSKQTRQMHTVICFVLNIRKARGI